MNALTAALKEELNVEMVSVFGLQIPESVVVSWGIMVFLVLGSILLTRNLRVDHITKRQAVLETVVTTINDFFVGLLGAFVIMELIKLVVPVFVPAVFSLYFDLFDGLIQTYVFVFLTSLFMKESIGDEE